MHVTLPCTEIAVSSSGLKNEVINNPGYGDLIRLLVVAGRNGNDTPV